MLLTDKYADKIYGTITCYDRMIIQRYIPGWSHAEGMTGYLNANRIRIFDFADFSQPLTDQIRANAQRIADENGIEIQLVLHGSEKGLFLNCSKNISACPAVSSCKRMLAIRSAPLIICNSSARRQIP